MKDSKLYILSCFTLFNCAIASLIAIRFFGFFPLESLTTVSSIFLVVSILGQMSLLVAVFGLLLLPIQYLPVRARYIVMAMIAATGLTVLFIDTIVFAQYRFHINAIVIGLIMAGDIVSFPLITWLMAIGGYTLLFALEYCLLMYLIRHSNRFPKKKVKRFASLFAMCFLTANLLYAWSAANGYQPIAMVKRYLPLYYPLTANSLMKKLGWVDLDALKQEKSLKVASKNKGDLNYPLNSIQGSVPEKKKDIMLLVIDSWRFDTFNKEITPNIWQLAQKGTRYHNHMSTGNATRTGIFGLFYGLPGTYWHAFLANQRSPVLMDRLQQLDYQLGIFSSAQLTNPEFTQTVFRNVPNLRIRSQGTSPSDKDNNLTQDWKLWYQQRDHSKPAFSFLFYDAPHGYDFPSDYPTRFEPMLQELNYLALNNDTDPTPLFNRYKTSVNYVDSLVKKVIDTLEDQGKLDDTVIIITGDHGQEMNDNKLNFWGHNSNFTQYQVKVPFIIFDLDKNKKSAKRNMTTLTSHEDVVPTLMKNYLSVSNSVRDYLTGIDLYSNFENREWIISSKYSGYGIIGSNSILEVNATGGFEIMDKENRPVDKPLDSKSLSEALEIISRYLK